jgi:hypothetical protein
MAGHEEKPVSPTVTRVLDAYIDALRSDEDLSEEQVKRLDSLLREGKVPKIDDIDEALYPPTAKDKS